MTQEQFLEGVSDPDNHRPLLWLALEATKGNREPVGEFGAGSGSTPYLSKYCDDNLRILYSFDSNKEWAEKWDANYITDWLSPTLYGLYSVVLIDQAPGEYRHTSMIRLKDDARIIVVHDAEPDESMGYRLEEVWSHFKYRVFVKGEKIWAAAVSNHYDLTQHVGEMIGNFKIEI